mmetsp:Transcript_25726/g.42816  ORF Transcript_25726/g.42816 Transcript_25726/m.42816 type:complete len:95 (+) Transcript_25726:117-401(+)|eukprot:CAMPEP_0119015582 /NCGR_PEP_ID=MMETSP1176-20130426/11257_1 /TAXON_ID=265551 /ORGANISM="Synedropsis recta cf, Strain CCMP1620" /LENGTH=94 /DNA_ID=CAMNT_0006968887 /DNA_START=97 /DNA_END=381 /DNA_ORIENTATION=+
MDNTEPAPEEGKEKRPVENETAAEPSAQRPRREWLAAPSGRRQPRIGDNFQVLALPTPSQGKEPKDRTDGEIKGDEAGNVGEVVNEQPSTKKKE